MAIKPKIEFFKFRLSSKKKSPVPKTFKDFALEILNVEKEKTDKDVFEALFKHFITNLGTEKSQDIETKKKVTLIEEDVNFYKAFKPSMDFENEVFSGVIQGGPYGRKRILSDISSYSEDTPSSLSESKVVLNYFFILIYIPLGYEEGLAMVHSNNSDESMSRLLKKYLTSLFTALSYKKLFITNFCPNALQREFMEGSTIKEITYETTRLEDFHSESGIEIDKMEFEIKIQLKPKNRDVSKSYIKSMLDSINSFIFKTSANNEKLENYSKKSVILRNQEQTKTKTFKIQNLDEPFIPVVFLDEHMRNFNEDGTPDFRELKELCYNLLKNEILPELRPDLNVTRA